MTELLHSSTGTLSGEIQHLERDMGKWAWAPHLQRIERQKTDISDWLHVGVRKRGLGARSQAEEKPCFSGVFVWYNPRPHIRIGFCITLHLLYPNLDQ